MSVALGYADRIAASSLPALRSIKGLMQRRQRPHIEAALTAEAAAYREQLGVTTTLPGPR